MAATRRPKDPAALSELWNVTLPGSILRTFLAFLAILGGLLTFGPLGFLIGPVILSLLY